MGYCFSIYEIIYIWVCVLNAVHVYVTLMLGVYRFLREASAAERLSVLQFTHMA